MKMLILFFPLLVTGCSFFNTGEEKTEPVAAEETQSHPAEEKNEEKSKTKPLVVSKDRKLEEIDLKQAKIWARLDEIEEELRDQREKMTLVERGIKTGIVPNRFKNHETKPKKEVKKLEPKQDEQLEEIEKQISENAHAKKAEAKNADLASGKPVDEKEIRSRVAKAQDLYRAGSFGASIAELDATKKELGDTEDGICNFWTARNWLALKEYQTARDHFETFSKKYPQSPHIPRAKYEQAKAESAMGLKSKSMTTLQDLIKVHPNEEASEMARMELDRLRRNL